MGLVFELILSMHPLGQFSFMLVALISGFTIAKKGLASAMFRKRLDMNFLMTVAAVGAFLIGHGEEGAAVIFLFYVAEFLEDYAVERTRQTVGSLMKLAPEVAIVKHGDREVEVHAHEVAVNDVVIVRPGEKIPLDGVVVKGFSYVNQAMITGESIPVSKVVDDEVYAGTMNCEGYIEVRVTKRADETLLSKIVRLVEEAQKQKSPTEKFVERFSKYYTPSVVFAAMLVATIPTLLFGLPFADWLYKSLVLLVVSCPCALAISTPVSIVSGMTSAARNGVLIKGGVYLEEISRAKVFAFDKTGTLTEGRLEVTDVAPRRGSREEVLTVAASLESLSEHPIASAMVKKAKTEGLRLESVDAFTSIPGKGVRGRIESSVWHVGNKKLFKELAIDFPEEYVEKLEEEGKTVVLVGREGEFVGAVAVMDRIRDVAVEAISELKKKGIKTAMMSGDNERTARAVAKRMAIDEYFAELSPEDKIKKVEGLRGNSRKEVVMVGDGVNDAPALAEADIGVVMGAIGSDVALETADVALMEDDLSKLPYLVDLSRRTVRVMKTNIAASLLIKSAFAVLAFPGLVTLWLAVGVGDMGLSLAVILNAMRLSLIKPESAS